MRPHSEHAMVNPSKAYVGSPFLLTGGENTCINVWWNWSRIFRFISLVGLATAVFFWGLSYKLSLYHFQNQERRTTIAKVWVGPRPRMVVAKSDKSSQGLTINPQFVPPVAACPTLCVSITAHAFVVSPIHNSELCNLLNSLRSPPPHSI